MKCTKCGAELAPFADGCASCAMPPPLPTTHTPTRSDISWLAFTLISLPFLLVSGLCTYSRYPGDDPKAQGVIVGTAGLAAGIAWLLCRKPQRRFRLTWALAYMVIVLISAMGWLTARAGKQAAAPTAATAASEQHASPDDMGSAPATTGGKRMPAPWPAGWTVNPSAPLEGTDGVFETAVLVEDGNPVAAVTLILGHDAMRRTTADSMKVMMETALDSAHEASATGSFTEPTATTWAGRDAMQVDASFTQAGVVRRQRTYMTQGADYFTCSLNYTALEAVFDKHVADAETMRDKLDCR